MKANKKLQKIADQSFSEYHNEEVANELRDVIKTNNHGTTTIPKKRKIIFASSFATAVLAVAIIVMIVMIPTPDNSSKERYYLSSNQKTIVTDVDSLNADSAQFTFNLSADDYIVKMIDTYYNETLYYDVTVANDIGEALEFFVVTNNDYEFAFNRTLKDTAAIDKFTLSYSEKIEMLDQDLYYVESVGAIITSNEKIYLTYTGLAFEESSNFIEFITQIITVK